MDFLPRLTFLLACLFFSFLYGFAASQFQWWPHGFLSRALSEAKNTGSASTIAQHHTYPARHDLQGVRSYGDEPSARGATLVTSYWPDRDGLPGLRLIDSAGATLHHWDANPARIWPTSPHEDSAKGLLNQSSNYVHGSYLFPNGDVLFNIEFLGLARLDAKGDVIWRVDRRTHHSVTPDENGNFWVCEAVWVETEELRKGRFPGLTLPLVEDRVLLVSPEGKILEQISILEIVFESELKDLVWRIGKMRSGDILHLNDVESLSTAMAAEYPMFEAGDLLVSLRFLDAVFVVDPDTKKVKWSAHEPFMNQHDPDFIGDGWISVFDNHGDESLDGSFLGGSRLLALRPHTGESRGIYPREPSGSEHERYFYTLRGGKAQQLENGNWLITESQSGRVFEIDGDGKTVWEWVHTRRADGFSISEVLEGSRYRITAQDVGIWKSR